MSLKVNGALDREHLAAYSLRVVAYDGGAPPLSSELAVEVVVQDVNDNHPVFSRARYNASVPENAEIGSLVLKVSATDADDRANISYAIKKRETDEFFAINSSSGKSD